MFGYGSFNFSPSEIQESIKSFSLTSSLNEGGSNSKAGSVKTQTHLIWDLVADYSRHQNVSIFLASRKRDIKIIICVSLPIIIFFVATVFFILAILGLGVCALVEVILDHQCVNDPCEYCSISAAATAFLLFAVSVVDLILCSLCCVVYKRRLERLDPFGVLVKGKQESKNREKFISFKSDPSGVFKYVSEILSLDTNQELDFDVVTRCFETEGEILEMLWEKRYG